MTKKCDTCDDFERVIKYLEKKLEDEREVSYSLYSALRKVVDDRNALLKKLGLTDMQWSLMGGACANDFE